MESTETKDTQSIELTIRLSKELAAKARKQAKARDLTLAEYVQSLVDQDAAKAHEPWREPVPPEVAERWSRELAEFDEEERAGKPRKTYHSADEYIQDMQDKP